MRKMRAYLVGLARMQSDLRFRYAVLFAKYRIFGDDTFRAFFRFVVDPHQRALFVLFQIRRHRLRLGFKTAKAERVIGLFYVLILERPQKLAFGSRVPREYHKTLRVSVQSMDKPTIRPVTSYERGEHRLGVDPAFLIDDEDIPVLVNDMKGGFFFLFFREVVTDHVARFERDVRSRLFAVDLDVFVFQERAEEKRGLGVGVVGKFFERLVFV